MRIVTAQELKNWLDNGQVLEKDGRGPKVVKLDSGLFLKIFHTRRHPLLARLFPFAKKFAHNIELLHKLGIPAPEVVELFWIDRSKGLTGCQYRPLPGIPLEALHRQAPEQLLAALPKLARFIRELHDEGIYFRSLHLGNIILTPSGEFGLIDVLDLRKKSPPITRSLARRNFRHLENYLARKKIKDFPLKQLVEVYESM